MSGEKMSDSNPSPTKNATCFDTKKVVDVRRLEELLKMYEILKAQERRYVKVQTIVRGIVSDFNLLNYEVDKYPYTDLKSIAEEVSRGFSDVTGISDAVNDAYVLKVLSAIESEIISTLSINGEQK